MATAAVIKLLLDWLLPLGLVYETALLPPHMRYRRSSEPTRAVFHSPLPGSQWAQHASGSTEAPAGGAATSRGAAEPAPPPIKRLRGKVPPPPPLLPPKIPEDRPLSPMPSLHPDEQDDGKAMGARDPSSPPPPSSPTDMPEASQLPSPTTPAKSAEFGVEGADQTPEGWEAHPESGYGSTSTSGCWSGGDGPGGSEWKPPLPSDPPHPLPPWCHNVQSAQWSQCHPAPRIRCRLLQHGGGPRRRQRRRANPGAHHEDLGGGNRGNSCSERSQWHSHFRRGGSPGDVHARPAGRRRPGKRMRRRNPRPTTTET